MPLAVHDRFSYDHLERQTQPLYNQSVLTRNEFMAEQTAHQRGGRGVYWRQMRVGDYVGRPLAEWAFRTPRHPEGLTATDLRNAAEGLQRETALFWFLSNLKPYKLENGVPYSGFGSGVPNTSPANSGPVNGPAGFGVGYWAPAPLNAEQVLADRFIDILPESLLSGMGQEIGGQWMWLDQSVSPTSLDQSGLIPDLLRRLAEVEDTVGRLRSAQGTAGQNGPPEEISISGADASEILEIVRSTRDALFDQGAEGAKKALGIWTKARPIQARLGQWLLTLGNEFSVELARSAGKEVGKMIPHAVWAGPLGVFLWNEIGVIDQLLRHLAK